MFESVLIANRGEIAVRVIRTASRLGLRTIAVYSDADRTAKHVALADEAWHIGPPEVAESYLRADVILDVAKKSKASAIHPGYGFLSENAGFADQCAAADIVFVGPPADAIRAMGLKDAAKRLMQKAGVPVVPGYHGADQDDAVLSSAADDIGYPVLIKAVAGGGGKGMRKVDDAAGFKDALDSARREAASAFGDDRVLVERFVGRPRHIEIQVFADSMGDAVHLFERDCSLQRRHQKVVEEAPAPGMPEAMRARMGEAAVAAAKAVGYQGAGTVEFIADTSEGLREDGFFFMEMNTRLQVEHPVTELITGVDLVEWQLRVASGEPLPLRQDELAIDGHAMEVRLYAEDPDNSFLPSTGHLHALEFPTSSASVRIDSGVDQGDDVSRFYDPMIAKIIAHGHDRAAAIANLSSALEHTVVAGVKSNLGYLSTVLANQHFRAGEIDTAFLETHGADLEATVSRDAAASLAAVAWFSLLDRDLADLEAGPDHTSPWRDRSGWQLGASRTSTLHLTVNGVAHWFRLQRDCSTFTVNIDDSETPVTAQFRDVVVEDGWLRARLGPRNVAARLISAGAALFVLIAGRQIEVLQTDLLLSDLEGADGGGLLRAPMSGKLQSLFVSPGDTVSRGDRLAILEAMKMEHTLAADMDGIVGEVNCKSGEQVREGDILVVLQDVDAES